jgi:L-ascorbate metabolism protein UlaG (beta-lactamase superfamily)
MKRSLTLLAVFLVVAPAWVTFRWNQRPNLDSYSRFSAPSAGVSGGALRATFLGVSTLWFDDGETGVLIDGFFSRPGAIRSLLGRVEPDQARIEASLSRARIERLAAVVAVHSHYDHAMDSPEVARRTGALLIGSESTANIARGEGFAEERIRVAKPGVPFHFGRFTITLLPTLHFPHGMAMGEIREPLVPPVRTTEYKEGGSYSVWIEHGGRALLVQGSAGYIPGVLRGRKAETVFLGLAGLATRDEAYRDGYWREVVEAVDARRVVPIHWDDFTQPLESPLAPISSLIDDILASLEFLIARSEAAGVEFQMVDAWQTMNPFSERRSQ